MLKTSIRQIFQNVMVYSCLLMAIACQQVDFSNHSFAPLPEDANTDDQKRLAFLTEIINDDASAPDYFYQRAKLNYKLERYRVALRDIEACMRLDENQVVYLYWKAAILLGLNDYEQALDIANQAVARGLRNSDMDVLLGQLHYHNGNTADALQYLENAYQLFPNNPNAAFYLGAIFDDREDSTSAVKELKHAIELKPSYTDAYLRLILIYDRADMNDKVGLYVKQALENCQPDAAVFLEMGHWLWRESQKDSATYWYRRALQMRPALWEANYQLAQYYLDEHNYALAESYYKEALSYNPNIKNGYFQIGYIYEYYLNQLEDAKTAYQKGLRIDQENTKVLSESILRVERKMKARERALPGSGL